VHGEATAADILKATALAHEVLGRSLDDLPPQTRRLLHLIRSRSGNAMVDGLIGLWVGYFAIFAA
jgi:hypothetical protein